MTGDNRKRRIIQYRIKVYVNLVHVCNLYCGTLSYHQNCNSAAFFVHNSVLQPRQNVNLHTDRIWSLTVGNETITLELWHTVQITYNKKSFGFGFELNRCPPAKYTVIRQWNTQKRIWSKSGFLCQSELHLTTTALPNWAQTQTKQIYASCDMPTATRQSTRSPDICQIWCVMLWQSASYMDGRDQPVSLVLFVAKRVIVIWLCRLTVILLLSVFAYLLFR